GPGQRRGRSNSAEGGAESRCPATLRRPAQRAAVVVAHTEGSHARGEGGSVSAAGAARRDARIPRVLRGPAERVVRVPAHTEIRQIGTADGDRARRTQLPDVR